MSLQYINPVKVETIRDDVYGRVIRCSYEGRVWYQMWVSIIDYKIFYEQYLVKKKLAHVYKNTIKWYIIDPMEWWEGKKPKYYYIFTYEAPWVHDLLRDLGIKEG